MISILAVSLVGSWSYSSFLAEPTPSPSPAPSTSRATAPMSAIKITPTSAPIVADLETKAEPPRSESLIPPAGPATRPAAPPASMPPMANLYRSTDASGQTWEHADPAYLASFVESRNRSIVNNAYTYTYTYASPQPSRASRCANGRCR